MVWKGDDNNDTWEPIKNLDGSQVAHTSAGYYCDTSFTAEAHLGLTITVLIFLCLNRT